MEANITTLTNERYLELIEAEKDLDALKAGFSIIAEGRILEGFNGCHYTRELKEDVRKYDYIGTTSEPVVRLIEENKTLEKRNLELINDVSKLRDQLREFRLGAVDASDSKKWYQFWK